MNGNRSQKTSLDSGVGIVLAIFIVLGSIYSILTPIFEASDELWHYPMVKTLADGNGLPIQDPKDPGPWRQEGSQPPLYYAISALSTSWMDTSDMDEVRRLNPHADNGIITADGNNNIVVHNPERDHFPWRGTVLAVHIIRFLSVLMGASTVYFTFLIGREVFPHQIWLARSGSAIVALTPMFLFISGSVNNDNLGILISTITVWLLLRYMKAVDSGTPTLPLALNLGVSLGIAALSKQSALGLFGLTAFTLLCSTIVKTHWRNIFVEGPIILSVALVLSGWWYYRNLQLYGDPTGLNTFLDIVGRRSPPASIIQLWGERVGFLQSYWGLFGGVSIPMPSDTYLVLNTIAFIGTLGAVIAIARIARQRALCRVEWLSIAISLLWIPAVVLPLVFGWTRFTLASQGRLIFSAISVISLWLAVGLNALVPVRFGKLIVCNSIAYLGTLAIAAPFLWISPHYEVSFLTEPPIYTNSIDFAPPDSSGPAMRLIKSEISPDISFPGEQVVVRLWWESLSQMDRNWSTFVHLSNEVGIIEAQRDTYPGLGLIATEDLRPGRVWLDTYVINISPAAYVPETLTVDVGLYDLVSGRRMIISGTQKDSAMLGTINLVSKPTSLDVPNPVSFNFGNQLELVGYSLSTRQVSSNQSIVVRLFSKAKLQPITDYKISIQVLDQQQIIAQQDVFLMDDNQRTTSKWEIGRIVANDLSLNFPEGVFPGTYNVQLVIYSFDNGQFQRLQLITEDNRITDDYLILTKVRILP